MHLSQRFKQAQSIQGDADQSKAETTKLNTPMRQLSNTWDPILNSQELQAKGAWTQGKGLTPFRQPKPKPSGFRCSGNNHTETLGCFRFRFRPSESADEDYDPIRTWGIKNTRSSRFVTVQLGQTR